MDVAAKAWLRERRDTLILRGLNWSLVAKFMRTRLAQVGAFIPALGYALLWSKWAEDAFVLNSQLVAGGLTPTSRLLFLYWGAIFLTAALIIYWWKCPSAIKFAPDVDEFLFRRAQVPEDKRVEKISELLRDSFEFFPQLEGDAARRIAFDRNLRMERTRWVETNTTLTLRDYLEPYQLLEILNPYNDQPKQSSVFRAYYHMLLGVNPNSIMTSAACLAIGVALWAIPAGETFLLVLIRVMLPALGL